MIRRTRILALTGLIVGTLTLALAGAGVATALGGGGMASAAYPLKLAAKQHGLTKAQQQRVQPLAARGRVDSRWGSPIAPGTGVDRDSSSFSARPELRGPEVSREAFGIHESDARAAVRRTKRVRLQSASGCNGECS